MALNRLTIPVDHALRVRLERLRVGEDSLARVARRVLRTGLVHEERLAGIDTAVVVPAADEQGAR